MNPFWVTLEGVEGVGKTYLAKRLAPLFGPRCLVLSEVTDVAAESVPGQVITALFRTGDVFLRTGHPLTETFALLALKVREYERLQPVQPDGVDLVLEDRGVDTVAVYQAAILAGDGPAEQTYALARQIAAVAARWRPPPDLTLLLVDDPDTCAARFAARLGRSLQPNERALMGQANQLYARLAAAEPARFVVVDRAGRTDAETLSTIHETCLAHVRRRDDRCAT
jgi:dTMP kinase